MAATSTAAVLGGAAIGGITSLLSGIIGSQAADKISSIEEAGIAADIGLQKQGLEHLIRTDTQARNDTLPWMESGRNALDQWMVEMGLPKLTAARPTASTMPDWVGTLPGGTSTSPTTSQTPGTTTVTPGYAPDRLNPPRPAPPPNTTPAPASGVPTVAGSGFRETPGYQFGLQQGTRSVVNNLGALGMKGSGAGLKALQKFGQGYADQNYGDYMTRLWNTATGGQQATSNAGAQSLAGAGQVAGALSGIGSSLRDSSSARASGYASGTNAWLGALQGAGNSVGNSLGWLSRYGR